MILFSDVAIVDANMLSHGPELLNGVIRSEPSAHVTGVCNESAISGQSLRDRCCDHRPTSV